MKKWMAAILGCSFLWGCTGNNTMTWHEKANPDLQSIVQGIPAYQGKNIVYYDKQGKQLLTAEFGEPTLVSVAQKPRTWGYYQFPNIYRSDDGGLVASWHMAVDAIDSYGKGGIWYAKLGKGSNTWERTGAPGIFGGLELPSGDRIRIYTPRALPVDSIFLPKPIDSAKENYGSFYKFYEVKDLPDPLRGVYLERLQKGATSWQIAQDSLDDPTLVRNSELGLFAVVWWGDIHQAPDGSLIAGIYPGFHKEPDERVKASGITFYRSTDEGRIWKYQGQIPYLPDPTVDVNGNKRLALGFTEPTYEILEDGSLICVMRTTDGLGNGPMYWSRSTDLGVTWNKPVAFTPNGVLPRLLRLENGALVLASGRPGVQLRFSVDGKGDQWTDPFELLPFNSEKDVVSCGYAKLLPTGKNRFLIIYSDFKYRNADNEIRKAIKIQEISVTPQ